MKKRPSAPTIDPDRLARIRARVLVTVTAGAVAAAGCSRGQEHTINTPAPPTINNPPTLPRDAGPATQPPAPQGPADASAQVLPEPTMNPPAPILPTPVRPRMPPGNG